MPRPTSCDAFSLLPPDGVRRGRVDAAHTLDGAHPWTGRSLADRANEAIVDAACTLAHRLGIATRRKA